jgi:hypothetical protein
VSETFVSTTVLRILAGVSVLLEGGVEVGERGALGVFLVFGAQLGEDVVEDGVVAAGGVRGLDGGIVDEWVGAGATWARLRGEEFGAGVHGEE